MTTSTVPQAAAPAPTPRLSRGRLALAGVLTGAVGLAASEVTAALLRERLSPRTAVAEAVIEATPGKVALTLVHLVGRLDKPLLLSGVLVALILVSAAAGVVSRSGVWRGQLVFLALAVFAGICVLSRSASTSVSLLPVAVGAGVWIAVLPMLTRPPEPALDPDAGRRSFLLRAGMVGLAAVALGVGSRFIGAKRRTVEAARARLALGVPAPEVPPGANTGTEGISPWKTPNADFYRIDTAVAVPAIEAADWKLRIHGMVDREVTLTFDDLRARQLTDAWVTLCCVSNPVGGNLISNAWWSGVRIADLLKEARPHPGADAVLQTSADGWTCGTPLAALTDDRDAMLAIAMNGEPLPLEHGFPVRMVVPGLYGYVSACKWVVDLEVSRFADFSAFWTQRGWSPQGPVRTESRIDVPRADHRVTAGTVAVGGVAWAQHTGIEKVEVQLDSGPWQEVRLGSVPSVDTWVQWSGSLQVEPGSHDLAVRATDRSGYVQTAARRDVVPDGATGWHTIRFTAE